MARQASVSLTGKDIGTARKGRERSVAFKRGILHRIPRNRIFVRTIKVIFFFVLYFYFFILNTKVSAVRNMSYLKLIGSVVLSNTHVHFSTLQSVGASIILILAHLSIFLHHIRDQ